MGIEIYLSPFFYDNSNGEYLPIIILIPIVKNFSD
jgi:hypothetical protein